MHEDEPISFQKLQDEAFAAKEADAEFLGELHADLRSQGAAEEGVFLANDLVAEFAQVERDDFAGIRSAKSDATFAAAIIREMRHEHRFARQDALAGGDQFAEEA